MAMKLDKVKKLAARLLKTGTKNIWMNPEEFEELKGCMTKEDVREQIKKGHLKKKASFGQSMGRSRKMKEKRKKGRKRGFGKRRGTVKARVQKKRAWIQAVRAQRKFLVELKEKKKVSKEQYSKIYRLVKGGYFKGKRYIEHYLKETAK
jgi:large subunit ribosomal protein L19e